MTETADSIPWHPAFVQAFMLELEPWQDALEFIPEYRLTSEPLQIDMVIVKKAPDRVIDKNIARMFRRVNILEYKSPDDYFSVSDFYKTRAYALLYAALNNVSEEDMTLSIIENRHPRELLKHIGERQGRITETAPGIYHITGYPLAIQVIESGKLSFGENLWLRGLGKDLNPAAAGSILEESRKRDSRRLGAYLYALANANIQTVQEVLAMAGLPLDKWVEETGLAAKWEKSGWQKAEAQYQPVLAEKDRAIGEKDRTIGEKDRAIGELRRKLREAGIAPEESSIREQEEGQ